MTSRARTIYSVGAVFALLAIAASVLHARESWFPARGNPERILYLTNDKAARRLFLSFDALGADAYWIRTIQHYGRDRKSRRETGRFELLQPMLDLTTTLDPNFMIAYRFGAIFLAMAPPDGPGRPDQAVALLEKGLRANPTRWQLAHDIGFIHYWYTGDYAKAAEWFERASLMPHAPVWMAPLAATTKAQGGNRAGARQMLVELLTSSPEEYIRNAAERGIHQLNALDAIDELNTLIERFHTLHGRSPSDLREIVPQGAPLDDTGAAFVYDPVTHKVSLSPSSTLAPLPKPFGK